MTDHHYSEDQLALDLKWWAAANYLTVAQIYLKDNTLLREPLRAEHIKPRLLGHWGTSPGLSMIYTLLNRHIVATGADWLYVTGPGHGGPALVASTYLEGTYSEIYPEVSDDAEGIHRMCRRFSAPGGVPSHVSVQTPGSIHEGGELGYALAHAAGAAFDHPNLVVACVIGDGEAETGPLSGSWKLPAFLNPRRDGAVLPILHVNGAKIAGPTVYGRSSDEDIQAYLGGQGWAPIVVSGDDPDAVFPQLYQAISQAHEKIREMQGAARRGEEWTGSWPAIVLRTPKGWTGPHTVDGILVEGTHRAHQVPLSGVRTNESHLRQLEEWMRSYRPDELFDANGSLAAELAALSPTGDKRMGSTPYANGGRLRVDLPMPPLEKYALPIQSPGSTFHETTRVLGELLRDIYAATETEDSGGIFRLFCPDETASNRLGAVFETTDRCWQLPITDYDDGLSADGRVMEVLSEHLCEGWLEGYLLSGRHGMFASYEAFAMVSVSMLIQHAKWLQHAVDLPWRASVASLNVLLTSTCWRNDHNGFSHQGPGMIDAVIPLAPSVIRVWLPPDSNTLLSISDHCLRSTDHVNLIVVDKQPHLQYLTLEQAHEHCAAGASVWEWAGTEARGQEPDVVLAAAGDVPTQEILAAAQLLRDHTPELITRVVNVVDLMALLTPTEHPHGFGERVFLDLFSAQTDVVFAFHGYSRAVHELIHGRPSPERFHVRGFSEQGTTTTPFDMVVLNKMSRYHLVIEALRRSKRRPAGASELAEFCRTQLEKHSRYIVEHLEDMPEVENWTWS
ncbi:MULTISPECIES: phosphoketolase family protein [Rhodococcus]|uniref:phosphoketolase family protein n=1 Tax=Rhodococcus TaxID=1827 RepID=UPI0002B7CA60|nr:MULTISPECIES: phosphoketolase family protein [Rhodococcus]EME25690.1 phosphoketolase [Rhodococcus qingshengii BKS 20-40]KPH21164.1 phosphoketolase [Rhodococcus sp. ADH]MCQ4150783.1 phosphoketolase family protein [Rhodococcus qingshengii]MDJ0489288.1 phosphoketolase family protein [Rhodococcus qingshengii]UEL31305.1 phosphoketolase family protein [Rhodococcus sp. C1]